MNLFVFVFFIKKNFLLRQIFLFCKKKKRRQVLGSAVNPVLREGNSDRRAPPAVKAFSKTHPHKLLAWDRETKARVVHMNASDFYASETSTTVPKATSVRCEFVDAKSGQINVLKKNLALQAGEVIDTSVMNMRALQQFYEQSISDAKRDGLLLSLHLKATMMKISDPVLFGLAVTTYYKDVFAKHASTLKELGVSPTNGLGDLYAKIKSLPADKKAEIERDITAVYAKNPPLAMVDSEKVFDV